MAVKIRLKRIGTKKAPFYRVVVMEAKQPRDGRVIDMVGRYNPRTNPTTLELDKEKAAK
ncbi:MAG: 30S ribosomal protein S16, partial [Candidatus Margulisiibacteriota bacterium]